MKEKLTAKEAHLDGTKFHQMFFPADYYNLDEVKNYLYYKYGISLNDCSAIPDTLDGPALFERLYFDALSCVFKFFGNQITDNFNRGDLLFLLIKEYLYLYCNSLSNKRSPNNPFSEEQLAKVYSNKSDAHEHAKTIRKYSDELKNSPCFKIFQQPLFYTLFESEPFSVIAYNLIALSHDNSFLLYKNANPELYINSTEDLLKTTLNKTLFFSNLKLGDMFITDIFYKTITCIQAVYNKFNDTEYKWEEYSEEEKVGSLRLLYLHLSQSYNYIVKNGFGEKNAISLWEKLKPETQDLYKAEIKDLFEKYLENALIRSRSKKGKYLSGKQWNTYLAKLTSAFLKIFPDQNSHSNIYKCQYLSSLWISEALIPAVVLIDFFQSIPVSDIIKETPTWYPLPIPLEKTRAEKLSEIVLKLCQCPNIFIHKNILNNLSTSTDIWDFCQKANSEIHYLSQIHYPLLEIIFHISFKKYFPDLDSVEKLIEQLPDTFFQEHLDYYKELLSIDIKNRETPRKRQIFDISELSTIDEFLASYVCMYEPFENNKFHKVDRPLKIDQIRYS